MEHRCAWCKCELGPPDEGTGISHGICQSCANKLLMGKASEVFEAINTIAYPNAETEDYTLRGN